MGATWLSGPKNCACVNALNRSRGLYKMPPLLLEFPEDKYSLYELGMRRVTRFCAENDIPGPSVKRIQPEDWLFDPCAFYRPTTIQICLEKCGRPADDAPSRNWTWPGSTTDREPYGVLAHELGHHCDWWVSHKRGSYYGDYSIGVRRESGEPPITSYCPNDAEWFAEIFRVFVTNHGLLKRLRPATYGILARRWKPVGAGDWRQALGRNVPDRIVKSLCNKGA